MKKNILSLAALFITSATFVACSNDESIIEEEPQQQPAAQSYSLTIDAAKVDDSALTRALTPGEQSLTPTWGANDAVAALNYTKAEIVYELNNSSNPNYPQLLAAVQKALISGSLTAETPGSSTASLTGELTGTIEVGDVLYLIFPYQTISNLLSLFSANFTFEGQDGTIEKIATTYDYCLGKAKVTAFENGTNGGKNITAVDATNGSGAINFVEKQAIVKFTLMDKENNQTINASSLNITAENAGVITLVTSLNLMDMTSEKGALTIDCSNSPKSVIYAALSGVEDSDVTLTATVGSDTYTYTKSNVTFTNGQYYEITVKMTKQ